MNNTFKAPLKQILTFTAWNYVRQIYGVLHTIAGPVGGRTNDW